jgi:hypothetical protein
MHQPANAPVESAATNGASQLVVTSCTGYGKRDGPGRARACSFVVTNAANAVQQPNANKSDRNSSGGSRAAGRTRQQNQQEQPLGTLTAIKNGEAFLEAKSILKHGGSGSFVRRNTPFAWPKC